MTAGEKIKVWDIAVRLFHWSLVILFVVAYLTGEDESELHVYAGYGIIGLIAFRVVWGFIGTRYARFSDFIYGPRETMDYAKSLFSGRPKHYLGHNPLAGWMVIALLLALSAASWTGLKAYGAEGYGPLANAEPILIKSALANGDDNEHDREHENGRDGDNGEGDEFWEEAHEATVNFSLLLVFLHIAGVLVSSVLHRHNLVRPMITGYKHVHTQKE